MENKISEAAKRERAAYMRAYRKRHPEKTREVNRRYWEKRAREARENAETAKSKP